MPSHDTATRAQVLALKQAGFKNSNITEQTKVCERQIQYYAKAAKERGWNPDLKGPILDAYVLREPGSGRPKKATPEKLEEILSHLEADRYGSEKSIDTLATAVSLSQKTVWRMLKHAGYRKTNQHKNQVFHLP